MPDLEISETLIRLEKNSSKTILAQQHLKEGQEELKEGIAILGEKLDGIDERVRQNEKDIARQGAWILIVGGITTLAAALSYLVP